MSAAAQGDGRAPRYSIEELVALARLVGSPSRAIALLALEEVHPSGLGMTGFAHVMQYTTAAATGIIDSLVVMHLVAREPVAGDRRRHTAVITQAGRDTIDRAWCLANGSRRAVA